MRYWHSRSSGVGGLIAANVFLRGQPTIDPHTLCPSSGPANAIAIVLDVTDPLTPIQKGKVEDALQSDISKAPVGTHITLGTVSPDSTMLSAPPFQTCKPQEGNKANRLYQNPKIIAERFEQGFAAPLDAALTRLLSAKPADTSPIMESIQATVLEAFGDLDQSIPKHLIVVSDLLQHSSVFSFYSGQGWPDFKQSRDFVRLGRNLPDTDVTLLWIPRTVGKGATLDQSEVHEFWGRYFEVQGAKRLRLNRIGDL